MICDQVNGSSVRERQRSWANAAQLSVALTIALRVGLGAVMAFAWVAVMKYLPSDHFTDPLVYGDLPMPTSTLGHLTLGVWPRWDAIHHLSLSMRGYFDLSPGESIFYPLYAGITWLVARLIGGNHLVAGLVVATLSTAATFGCLRMLADRLFGESTGRWACFALATYPMAIFLIAPFTESLFLFLTLAAFLAAYSNRWWIAAILAALASLSRAPGMATAPSIAIIAWRQWSNSTPQPPLRALPPFITAIVAPIAAGIGFLVWRETAGLPPLLTVLREYVGTTVVNPFTGLLAAFRQWVQIWDLPTTLDMLSAITFSCITVLMVLRPRWRKPELIVYMLISLLVLFSRVTVGAASLKSLSRYVLVLFPAFLVIGDYLSTARSTFRFVYLLASSTALIVLSALYALWFPIG